MINTNLLEIRNLTITINSKTVLNNLNLTIKKNETHVILGPNGSGKTTLTKVIAGFPNYVIKSGDIFFENQNIANLNANTRAQLGIFLAFQTPPQISGISNFDFLYHIYNQQQENLKLSKLSLFEFSFLLDQNMKLIGNTCADFLMRDVNMGFSGGEKKKFEVLQMLLLKPKFLLLDEIDSGLDLEATNSISFLISSSFEKKSTILIITHNLNILNFFKPDFIHILSDGSIIKTGNNLLLNQVKNFGYQF